MSKARAPKYIIDKLTAARDYATLNTASFGGVHHDTVIDPGTGKTVGVLTNSLRIASASTMRLGSSPRSSGRWNGQREGQALAKVRASLKKGWLPKTPWLRNEMIAAKAAMSRWYRLEGDAIGEPTVSTPYQMYSSHRVSTEAKDWCFYAANLGRARGVLPEDLKGWTAEVAKSEYWKDGDPMIRFYGPRGTAFYKPKGRRKALSLPIAITLKNLFVGPPEPAREEIDAIHESPEDAVCPARGEPATLGLQEPSRIGEDVSGQS